MSTAPPTPPTTPAGGPPPPAQTAAPEAVTLEGVVDALKPMFGSQAPNIDTWQTRLLVKRKLDEKKANGPLQGADITVEALLEKAVDGWDNPAVKSGLCLRAACAILGTNPVPATPPAAGSASRSRPHVGQLPGISAGCGGGFRRTYWRQDRKGCQEDRKGCQEDRQGCQEDRQYQAPPTALSLPVK